MLANVLPLVVMRCLILPLLAGLCIGFGHLIAGSTLRRTGRGLADRLLIGGLVGMVAISWMGTILAALGVFKWWLLAALLLGLAACCAVLPVWRRRRSVEPEPSEAEEARSALALAREATPWYAQLALAILLVGTGWLNARPAETYLLIDDASVYTIGGIVLANEGTLTYAREPIYDLERFDTTAAELVDLFYTAESKDGILATAFRGPFYTMPDQNDPVEIGFLPLPKVWGAIIVWLFGAGYAPWSVAFLGLAGVAALYGLARLALGWAPALLAAALLALSLPQIWFSRYALSEIPTQAFLVGGLYLTGLGQRGGRTSRAFYIWGAAALAAITLIRLEALFILGLLAAIGWAAGGRTRSHGVIWLATLAAGGLLGTATSALVAPSYLYTRLILIFSGHVPQAIICLLTVLAGLFVTILCQAPGIRRRWLARLDRWAGVGLRWGLSVAAVFTAVWCIWILARSADHAIIVTWLAQYLGSIVLILGILGIALILWPLNIYRGEIFFISLPGIAIVFMVLYIMNPQVNPSHPWAMRRLVPAVVPGLMIGVAAVAAWLVPWLWRLAARAPAPRLFRGLVGIIAVALACGQLGIVARISYPLWAHCEYGGLWAQLQELSAQMEPGAVVLLADSARVGVGRRLASALELTLGHPAYSLPDRTVREDERQLVLNLVDSARDQGREVYLLDVNGYLGPNVWGWELVPVARVSISTPRVRPGLGARPEASDVERYHFDLDVYHLPGDAVAGRSINWPSVEIPVGLGSLLYLRSGFTDQDVAPSDDLYRWTTGDAHISLPWPEGYERIDLSIALDWSAWRPEEEAAPELEVYVEGVRVAKERASRSSGRQVLLIKANDVIDRDQTGLDIRLVSDCWTVEGAQQELGIGFYGMEVELIGGQPALP